LPVLRLIALACGAEVLSVLGVFAFPSIQVQLAGRWALDALELGWINGLYYAVYGLGVILLSSRTDRVDARAVFLLGAAINATANVGFALLASGFWSALALRAAAGLGLAGTFIPALRMLLDRLPMGYRARGLSWYTSSFALSTSLSFFYAGVVADTLGWRWVFAGAGALGLLAGALVWRGIEPLERPPHEGDQPSVLGGILRVLARRQARLNILAYAGHMWELFALRTWLVSLLWFAAGGPLARGLGPTVVAALANLLAMGFNLGTTEAAHRFPRRRVMLVAMAAGGTVAVLLAFAVPASYRIIALGAALYVALAQSDSALLYTATVESVPAGEQGSALAAHSVVGFSAAFAGSLAVGAVLDLAGGPASAWAWSLALLTMGLGSAGAGVAVAAGAGLGDGGAEAGGTTPTCTPEEGKARDRNASTRT